MPATLAVSPPTASRATPQAIRVVPVPRSEPPTDDELFAAGLDVPPMTAPQLPFDLPHGSRLDRPSRSSSGYRPALARGSAVPRGSAIPPDLAGQPGAQPTAPTAPTPPVGVAGPSPARVAVRRLLATCLEVIGGFRPATQLRPFCLPERFDEIVERLTGRMVGPSNRLRGLGLPGGARTPVTGRLTGAPPRAGRAQQTGPGDRVAIRRVQVCEAIDGVAEVAVVLARREQVWAMALRLESHRGRWLCTHLEVV